EDGDVSSTTAWTSDRDGALGTGGTITHTLSVGTHTITARATDRDGNSGQAQVTIAVNAPPTVTISAPADHADFGHAVSITFRAGALGTGGSITATALSTGVHTITASVTDSSGKPGSMQVIVIVNTPPVVTITAPPAGTSPEPLAPVTFTATATDAEDGNLSSTVTWTSSRDGALGTGGTITTSALSSG